MNDPPVNPVPTENPFPPPVTNRVNRVMKRAPRPMPPIVNLLRLMTGHKSWGFILLDRKVCFFSGSFLEAKQEENRPRRNKPSEHRDPKIDLQRQERSDALNRSISMGLKRSFDGVSDAA